MKTLTRKKRMKKLIIFDLDGTLLNTTEAMKACGNAALRKLGLSLLEGERYARFSGADLDDFVSSVLSEAGDPSCRNADLFWRYYLAENEVLPKGLNVPYPGIPELLSELKKKGVFLAVLSNKDDSSCLPIIREAFGDGVFDVVRGQRRAVPPKPDRAGVLEMLRDFSVSPRECLYVGDTEVDMKTGKNAGVDTVAVLWGYREKEELAAFSPEFFAAKPLDILSIL